MVEFLFKDLFCIFSSNFVGICHPLISIGLCHLCTGIALITFHILIDLVTVFDAILTSRQTRDKLQCLYENLMSNNFRKTAVLNKISIVN